MGPGKRKSNRTGENTWALKDKKLNMVKMRETKMTTIKMNNDRNTIQKESIKLKNKNKREYQGHGSGIR